MGHFVQDTGDILDKAHVQHPIRLVQHHGLHLVQAHGAPLHVVHQPPGGGHHNLGLALELGELLLNGLAAVQAHRPHALPEGAQIPQLVPDLYGQLPGGGQDQSLDIAGCRVNMLHHRNAEGEGLAGAGGGLGHHVLPVHKVGDGPALNGSGLGEALFVQGFHSGLRQAHILIIIGFLHLRAVDFHTAVPLA